MPQNITNHHHLQQLHLHINMPQKITNHHHHPPSLPINPFRSMNLDTVLLMLAVTHLLNLNQSQSLMIMAITAMANN
ncbi:hypothetical protein VIGAN_09043200 [Vigna angularis var. angularis]|uniref:Uncharacterized protein n=1 Tax=Vigna angularis var. angularis TaxID=157739 RepID=A0A0S3SW19_PHAAN|nr:hypothetical protein VIGAN_09043200 [Vigna angularis var. angularis]